MNDVVPYFEYVLVEPVAKKQVLVKDTDRLETYGKVVAIGKDVTDTKIGEYVAFELWDVKDCSINGKKLYSVSEARLILKIPVSYIELAPSVQDNKAV